MFAHINITLLHFITILVRLLVQQRDHVSKITKGPFNNECKCSGKCMIASDCILSTNEDNICKKRNHSSI